jgi:hypothetical protein
MTYYEVGDLIAFNHHDLIARVAAKVDNLIDGQPGFIAELPDSERTWGLDSEIIDVIQPANPRQRKIIDLRAAALDMDEADRADVASAFRHEATRLEQDTPTPAPPQRLGLIRQYRVTLIGAPNTQKIVSAISADAARRMVARMMHNGVMAPAEIVSVDLHEQD